MVRKLNIYIGLCVTLALAALYPGEAYSDQEILLASVEDGTTFKVYIPEGYGQDVNDYARKVLEAACTGYKEVVFKYGFDRIGYTFSLPQREYAYDIDRVIEIYLADVDSPFALMAPQNDLEYEAKILVPIDYKTYRKKYDIDQPDSELRASLTHELLHIVTHSYNKNMSGSYHAKSSLDCERWDWYTEGLARYFERLAGYDKEFLSSGFRKKSGKKVLVYKGGVNYFLRYPDKPLDERKYDFALFWQFIHTEFGMDKIEKIACKFREVDPAACSNQEAMEIIARTLDIELPVLLQHFSLYVYRVSVMEAGDELKPVSMYKLYPPESETHTICSFGFDFYEVDLKQGLQSVSLNAVDGWEDLNCLVGVSYLEDFQIVPLNNGYADEIEIDVTDLPKNSKMIIMLSNPSNHEIYYKIKID
ncbi:MAG: hypothetical protein JW869_08105 [Candidatus Omnitrophica bacterium]|nr:hypothetical protein [Candidatus Omnitrophota bacterium]